MNVFSPLDVVCPKCHSHENVKCSERTGGIVTRKMIEYFHQERIDIAKELSHGSAEGTMEQPRS